MTDAELVAKKLALIETCIEQLRTLSRPDQIERDVREERFVEHTLQLAIQAALDAASHVVSDERLGEPDSNRDLIAILERNEMRLLKILGGVVAALFLVVAATFVAALL